MQHHPTGLRTHILVCIGSTMTMMLGQYLFLEYGTDPSRIGAQVVSGIGFLGVGTIISNKGFVRGITTAAGLWACACMGLALGAGFYMGSIIGFFTVMFTLVGIRKINNFYYKRHPFEKYIQLCLKKVSNLTYATTLLKKWGITVCDTKICNVDNTNKDKGFTIIMKLNMKNNVDSNTVLLDLLQEDCILSADYVSDSDIDAKFKPDALL